MTTGKLIIGVALGVLLAGLVAVIALQIVQPRDCALQRLEAESGERLANDVDEACR